MTNAYLAAVDAIANRVKQAHRTAREEKKAKPTPEAWRKIWHDELKKLYPAYVMTYSDAVANNLKRAVNHRGLPVIDVGPLIAWIVNNWPTIRRSVLSRNPKFLGGPEVPDMKLVIAYLPQIHGLFNMSKPEYALTAPKPNPRVTAAPPLAPVLSPAPAVKAAPAALPARPKPVLLKPLAIDHAGAERARQKLKLPKWD